jgi:hypothetical protein
MFVFSILAASMASRADPEQGLQLALRTGRDPWAGIGAGYEWLGSSRSSGAYSETLYDKGFQLNLQVGVDFPVAQSFFVAPFLTFAVGEYTTLSSRLGPGGYAEDITYSSLHELLTIGLRVSFNL